ncbi:Rho guanine nucleotide exchange factor 4 [Boothiomyces macroporosus]|uniref:Rho guanine nucleotide exchange factor 4 n=1 Tax=Boothiomyces macroporosus TaxID=261099 RepID=A0AAD5Y4H3_9FUNG|nr:Rho guanine nucleotide exchange factor 4 [Boothiomyces macroporosus]
MQMLFANVEQILSVNSDFLYLLTQIEDIRNINAYAEVFLTMGERFMCYIPYCSNQQATSAKFIKSLLSKGEIKSFLEEVYRNPMIRQLDLPGFLLKPIQRICKYPLLIREMIKNTPPDHSDLISINKAMERMQNCVATINECARKLNGMKPMLEVQNRFSEKINIVSSNRFLVREDTIQVMFSDSKKTRKMFMFNDMLILARKDWRDKHHVIEKTALKDIRVSDISETSGGQGVGSTLLLEIEILATSEYDQPNRYIIALASIQEKQTWLDAYKSLVRYIVKSKNINDITMTSSSADAAGEDDDNERVLHHRESFMEDDSTRAKKFDSSQYDSQIAELNAKVEALEKMIADKDGKIKEWETRVVKFEEDGKAEVEKLKNAISSKDEELKASTLLNGQLTTQVESFKMQTQQLQTRLEASEQEQENLSKSKAASAQEYVKEIQYLTKLLKDQEELTEKQILQTKRQEEITLRQEEETVLKQRTIIELNGKLNDLYDSMDEKEKAFKKADEKSKATIKQLQADLQDVTENLTKKQNALELVIEAVDMAVAQLAPMKRNMSSFGLVKRGVLSPSISKVRTEYRKASIVNDEFGSLQSLIDELNRTVQSSLQLRDENLQLIEDQSNNISQLSEQVNALKGKLMEKESNINDTSHQSTMLQKKIAELEQLLNDSRSQIASLKKIQSDLENLTEEQKVQNRKTITENELVVIELKSQLKLESDNTKALSQKLKLLETDLSSKDVQIKDQSAVIQSQAFKIQNMSGDVNEKDTNLKQISDRASSLQHLVDEIQNVVHIAQTDSMVTFPHHGGLLMQIKAFIESANTTVADLQKKCGELEHGLNNLKTLGAQKQEDFAKLELQLQTKTSELTELTIQFSKTKEKLAQCKTELSDAKEEIESMKMLLSQQKQNLEQARGTIEHMKITASSTDRQQKQTQAALEEARKECIAAHDRIKQQQAILQKNSESISELERKFEEQLADIHEKDTYAENLSRKIKEKESEIEELRSTVSLLQNKLSNREINIKELENKLAQIQKDFEEKSLEQGKVIKQLKIEVNDLQELHNSYKQQSGVDKERFKYDFERDVTNLKAKISDTETLLSSAHQKIQQKEYKCNELEQAVKDLKFKLSEQELSIANLQSKISSKDAKLLELESNNMNFISNNNSLKQKLSESESRILDIQSKLNEVESRNQKMEINLSASSANNSSQEQRIQELKSQIEDYTEQVKKLEREKKDLESQMEQLNYTLTSLNKEHRSLKESMEDSQSKLSKAETQAKLFAKDAQRDLEAMEEKYKLLMERERSDKALELASVKHELESLRKSATDEKLKLKQDFESNMAERIKSHQNEIEMLSKKFDFQLDELTQQLSRAKVDSKEKTEELKQQQQIEINQLKAKAEAASDSSRKTISELQENIHFSEKQISKLEESLKFKEIEAVKVALELEKAQDEIKKLKLSTISFEEGSYAKIKSLERDLEEKNINLAKRQEEIEEMNEKLEKTLAQQEALTADLVKERELSAQYSKKVEEAGFKISQTEAKYFSEISLLKSEKQDVEIKFHDHLLTIERMKTIEESHKEMIRKLVSDIELNKELLSKKEGEIDAIKEEKHKLQSSIKDHEHTVDKKTKDIETFGVQLRDLQETLKVRQEKIYTLTLENDQISAQNKQLIQEIENLEEELSDSKKNLKKADEHHKEELKKTAKESKKKYQIEMEELTSKLTAEKMSVLEKQELEFKSKMQRLVDEFEAYKTSASNDLTAAKTRSQLDEESRKELLEKINILEEEVGENNLREDNLVSELEDKVKQILQLKKRYKGSEEEHNNLLDQLRRLEQVNKDTADQLTEMYDKNIELQMQKQQVSLELEYSQKQIAQLQDYSTKYAEAQKTLQDLNNALADKKKELQDIETQNEALKKMVVKQTKSIASIQITLSEIGSLLEIQMPWSSEDIIALPEKMKNAFKAGKLRQIESIDTSLLLNVVTTVKDLVNEWKELKKSTVNQTHTIQDYQLMQNHAESQLKEASIAMEVIEARLRNQELQYGKEKLELKRKQEVLERSLDEALYKLDVSTKKSKILEENIEALKKEKQELEKDFIQLYERLQTSKNEFSQQTQLIYQDSSALIQQNESLKFQLSRHKEQLKSLSDQLSETSKEKAFANEMYQKTEMLLKEANENILRLTDRISSLQKEVQFSSKERDLSNSKIKNLQKDIDDLVIANNELQVSKAQSIRALEMELEKELKQIQTLSTTILESNYLLEDYKKYKAKYENLSNQYKKLENEKDGLEHQLQKQTVDLNNLQSEKEIQKEKNAELQHIYDSIKKEKEGLVHELQSVKYKKSPLDQIRNLSRNSSYSSSVDDRKLLDPRTTLDLKLSRNSSVVDKDDRKPLEPRIPFDLTHSRTSSYAESKLLDPRIVIDDNI